MLFLAKQTFPRQAVALVVLLSAAAALAQWRATSLQVGVSWRDASIGLLALVAVGGLDLLVLAGHRVVGGRRFVSAIAETLTDMLGGLSPLAAAGAGIVAGVGEEVFFRGALQPWIGLPATALVFGLCHSGTRPLMRLTVWAALEGVWFGLLYEITGSLLVPMVAHGLHDSGSILGIRWLARRSELLNRLVGQPPMPDTEHV